MARGEADSYIDPVGQRVDVVAKLTRENAVAAFYEAMQNRKGSVPVELVERYLEIIEDAHQAELGTPRRKPEASGGIKGSGGRFTAIHGELMTSLTDPTISTPELLGYAANLHMILLDSVITN